VITPTLARARTVAACLATGAVAAASLPPWGWWPLGFAGIALLDRLVADRPARARFGRAWLVGIGLYIPSLLWMADLTLPGYLIASAAYAALLGGAAAAMPASAPGRWLALPGAIAVVELVRWSWPFGGVPLSTLAIGQVSSPLAGVLRVGGTLLLLETTVIVGVALAAVLARAWRAAGAAAAVVIALVAVAAVAPDGHRVGGVDVALVQGGGPQGTRAADTDEREVFERHLRASSLVDGPVDVVFWPEDVVDVDGPVTDAREGSELGSLSRRFGAPVVAGTVEGEVVDGHDRFRNASVVFDAEGKVVSRYEKVHRVPFGEFVPLRSILEAVAGDSLISSEAIAGDGPAVIDIPGVGEVATAISWEVFFGDRVREGVQRGATLVANPTNGASFSGTFVQSQQVASSQMRAIETGRWVVQIAPTGFTAIVDHHGHVLARTAVSEAAVLQGAVALRAGETWYVRAGLAPGLAVAVGSAALAAATARRRRDRPAAPRPAG
jgi:apolipoprotein N-acyltransferase